MRVGFACCWGTPPEKTWSYTPWNLRQALINFTDVADIGISIPGYYKILLKALFIKYRNGKLISSWTYSGMNDFINERELNKGIKGKQVDAILQIGDLGCPTHPFYLYQDLSYDIVASYQDLGLDLIGFKALDKDTIKRKQERQHKTYEKASGIFAMSKWLADNLVQCSGVKKDKVHVVHAGINIKNLDTNLKTKIRNKKIKLLFLGVDFYRKGGDIAVNALKYINKEYDPEITLTVVGPEQWPMKGEVPKGVNFLGNVPIRDVYKVLEDHDILVLPSRFEAYGIIFSEALSMGLPCIGRNKYAMPEFIIPGRNGELINNDDPVELAECIWRIVQNDQIYDNVLKDRDQTIDHYNWNRVACDMVRIMKSRKEAFGNVL